MSTVEEVSVEAVEPAASTLSNVDPGDENDATAADLEQADADLAAGETEELTEVLDDLDADELPLGTLESIMAAEDLKEIRVPVEEWGCAVLVRGLSLREYEQIEQESTIAGKQDGNLLNAMTLELGMVQPTVTREQAMLLREKSILAVAKVRRAIREASGLGDRAIAQAEELFPD